MRNLKRLLAMALTMLMVVGCFAFSTSAQKFDDVYDYSKAIDVLSDLGVVWGYEDGTFGPDDAVLRWHMALWIAKMETGKVTTDDYLKVWRAEENYTSFKDVNVDQAIGAISYAYNEKIIIGTTATTFEPEAGITFQDALTMACRALGYSTSALDAGYPWSYINKANELGLEDGLTGISYTDELTRAQTAQILYNMLYAVGANGKTYAESTFGFTTVVITGTNNYKIIETESVIKTGYVSFNILNADGTINDDVTYHALASTFIGEDKNADDYVGASFKVTTKNNFLTIGTVLENPSKVLDQTQIKGDGKVDAASTTFALDGKDYEAVTKYSSLYNKQGIKGNRSEIIVFTQNETQASKIGYFKVDSSYNVLDAKGNIVAYYVPDITKTYVNPYAKKLADGRYTPYLTNDAIIADGGVWFTGTSSEYRVTTNTWDLVKYNAYATAKAYDDNADGIYDRLIYSYQEFGSLSYNADTKLYSTQTRKDFTVAKFIDKDGAAIAAAPVGSYIRYSYDPLSKYVKIYETYSYNTGLITGIVGTTSITIGGTTYTVSVPNFWGTEAAFTGVNNTLIGKQVNFILVDGKVVRVFDAALNATWIVFDNLTGLTAAGYATALVYLQTNKASVITIASIDGYSYQQYLLWADRESLSNITSGIPTGKLFSGTKDALGFWHLKSQDEYAYIAKNGTIPGYDFKWTEPFNNAKNSIYFRNGIANTESRFYYGTAKNYGTLKSFSQFATAADTVYIVYNKSNDTFYTAVGVPVQNAEILIKDAVFVSYDPNAPWVAKFVYVYNGSFNGSYLTNAWTAYAYDTVIYVPQNASAVKITNDLGTTGSLLGYTWQYGNVVDMINGGWVTVHTAYNFMLEPGCFYTVSNGYVEDKVLPYEKSSPVQEGLLLEAARFYSIIDAKFWEDTEFSAYTIMYKLTGGNPEVDVNGNLVNSVVPEGKTYNYAPIYFYCGEIPAKRVILYLDEATSTKTYGTEAAPYLPHVLTENAGIYKFTALSATAKADANYYLVNEEIYLATAAWNKTNANLNNWTWTHDQNTYDKWLKLYTAAGVEVTGWEMNFTALVDNVTNGSSIVRTPTYAVGLRYSNRATEASLPVGTYYMMWKYNNQIYKMWIKIQLNDIVPPAPIPTILDNLNASIYDVDMYRNSNRTRRGQNGTMDTGRILLDLGFAKSSKVDSGSSALAGPFSDKYQEDFLVDLYALPIDPNVHTVDVHGIPDTKPLDILNVEPIISVTRRFDVNGETILDLTTLINSVRTFKCSVSTCSYTTNIAYGDYIYAVKVTRVSTGETKTIYQTTRNGSANTFPENIADKVRWLPSWDVANLYIDDNIRADYGRAYLSVTLDGAYADEDVANDNTYVTILNRFKYHGWGIGTALYMKAPTFTPEPGVDSLFKGVGGTIKNDYGRPFTLGSMFPAIRPSSVWAIKTNDATYNSEVMFDQDDANYYPDQATPYHDYSVENEDNQKNFAMSWYGQKYQSLGGTYQYTDFDVYYVLPFAPYDIQTNIFTWFLGIIGD